jgi:hypothetical protein
VFGRRNLQRDGETATAVVVSAEAGSGAVTLRSVSPIDWYVKVLVHRDDGTSYPAEIRVSDTELALPADGDVLPVRVDPKSRSRVELDHAAFSAPAPAGDRSALPSDAEIEAASAAWDAAREQAAERMAASQEAKAAGDAGEAKRLFAEGQVFDAEQIRLGAEFRRLRAQRPDHESAQGSVSSSSD